MILTNESAPVITNGLVAKAFGVTASNKTFSILSSVIYKNPILAIVRELSCNAYDAHVAAKTVDKPFDIRIPSKLDPMFSIRDYGTGISVEDVFSIYAVYFESTKATSNQFTGALGLGSKSPLSYTNTFSVKSHINGETSVFTVFVDDEGIPSISHLSTLISDEPTGFEVSFAVKRIDIDDFVTAVASFYSTYPAVLPKIHGTTDVIVTKNPRYHIEGKSWYFDADRNGNCTSNRYANATVVQGNVPYPIRLDNLKDSAEFAALPLDIQSAVEEMCSSSLVFIVDIGTVKFAASREELQYTTATVKTVIDALIKIVQEAATIVVTRVLNTPTKWEAVATWREYTTVFSKTREYIGKLMGDRHHALYPNFSFDQINSGVITIPRLDWDDMVKDVDITKNSGRTLKAMKPAMDSSNIKIVPYPSLVLTVNDVGNEGARRIKRAYLTKLTHYSSDNVINFSLLKGRGKLDVAKLAVLRSSVDKFRQFVDIPTTKVVYASSLPPTVTTSTGKTVERSSVGTSITCRQLSLATGSSYYIGESSWNKIQNATLLTGPCFYVIRERYDIVVKERSFVSLYDTLSSIVRYSGLSAQFKNIYGVTATVAKKLPANWSSIWTGVADWICDTMLADKQALLVAYNRKSVNDGIVVNMLLNNALDVAILQQYPSLIRLVPTAPSLTDGTGLPEVPSWAISVLKVAIGEVKQVDEARHDKYVAAYNWINSTEHEVDKNMREILSDIDNIHKAHPTIQLIDHGYGSITTKAKLETNFGSTYNIINSILKG